MNVWPKRDRSSLDAANPYILPSYLIIQWIFHSSFSEVHSEITPPCYFVLIPYTQKTHPGKPITANDVWHSFCWAIEYKAEMFIVRSEALAGFFIAGKIFLLVF